MTKFQLLAAAAVAALAAACAGTQTASNETQQSAATASAARTTAQPAAPPAQTMTPAPAQQAQATTPAPTTPTTFTDDQLRSFALAAIEIDPISRTLATATPEQQATAADQIRQILARNNLDGATYNAIAARAQADQTFAARIQTLHRQAQTQGSTSGE